MRGWTGHQSFWHLPWWRSLPGRMTQHIPTWSHMLKKRSSFLVKTIGIDAGGFRLGVSGQSKAGPMVTSCRNRSQRAWHVAAHWRLEKLQYSVQSCTELSRLQEPGRLWQAQSPHCWWMHVSQTQTTSDHHFSSIPDWMNGVMVSPNASCHLTIPTGPNWSKMSKWYTCRLDIARSSSWAVTAGCSASLRTKGKTRCSGRTEIVQNHPKLLCQSMAYLKGIVPTT